MDNIKEILKEIIPTNPSKKDNIIKLNRKLYIYNILNNTNYTLDDLNIKIIEVINDEYNICYFCKILEEKSNINNLENYEKVYNYVSKKLTEKLNSCDTKIVESYDYPHSIFYYLDGDEFIRYDTIQNVVVMDSEIQEELYIDISHLFNFSYKFIEILYLIKFIIPNYLNNDKIETLFIYQNNMEQYSRLSE